ncbi:hypothetical protein PUNSTDRAFT_132083 [Punctularia strigosozonata HHB-11173 SS5]|uniref:uncharacterized protein n=1 Tax=Punctularia strigosozonata (strain HHB-11173) TaxID=741275 RepID=UPI000441840F|nr:uncharacterized protein PUNSTDRAFT_132083 [Punctularia strigosozonata HHB-11173 SS5]EIN11938.1 hypothetical protein PUNSTDRAFT_132083 [Punctularia strigosozonata HHB-11173 SS5]
MSWNEKPVYAVANAGYADWGHASRRTGGWAIVQRGSPGRALPLRFDLSGGAAMFVGARWGNIAHGVFICFCLATNIIVSSMLAVGGSATVTDLAQNRFLRVHA